VAGAMAVEATRNTRATTIMPAATTMATKASQARTTTATTAGHMTTAGTTAQIVPAARRLSTQAITSTVRSGKIGMVKLRTSMGSIATTSPGD